MMIMMDVNDEDGDHDHDDNDDLALERMIMMDVMRMVIIIMTWPVLRSSAFRLRKITGEWSSLPGVGGTPWKIIMMAVKKSDKNKKNLLRWSTGNSTGRGRSYHCVPLVRQSYLKKTFKAMHGDDYEYDDV